MKKISTNSVSKTNQLKLNGFIQQDARKTLNIKNNILPLSHGYLKQNFHLELAMYYFIRNYGQTFAPKRFGFENAVIQDIISLL